MESIVYQMKDNLENDNFVSFADINEIDALKGLILRNDDLLKSD